MLWRGPGHLAGREVLVDVERHQRDHAVGDRHVERTRPRRSSARCTSAARIAITACIPPPAASPIVAPGQRGTAVGVAARAVEVAADREVVEVVAGPLRTRAGLAVAARRAVDDAGVHRAHRRRRRCRGGRPRRAGSSRSPRRRVAASRRNASRPASATSGRAARVPCRGARCTRRTAARSARPTASAAGRPSRRARRSRPASATCARPGRRSTRSSTVTPSSKPVDTSLRSSSGGRARGGR